MKRSLPQFFRVAWWLLAVTAGGLFVSGCASTEPENASARPWNARQGWENGLPGGMFDRR